jgi:putative chitinase
MITPDILINVCPKSRHEVLEQYVEPLNTVGKYYDMFDNPKRLAGFVAQVAHESGGFNFIKENLNYSARGLMATFPKYFPNEDIAQEYEKQPEKIANKIYANRMGNGPEESGDGFMFCGRGLIQLTGRQNYTKFAQAVNMGMEDAVRYLETPEGATASAGWFWDVNKLNNYCDRDDFVGLTKRINGGTIGLTERQHNYEIVLQMLGN